MSHVTGITPAGPLTGTPGQTLIFDIAATVPADAAYALSTVGDDGVSVNVAVTVDKPALVLVLGGSGTLAPHQVRVSVNGGTLAPVAGQPTRVAWTLPA